MPCVLVVDDDRNIQNVLHDALSLIPNVCVLCAYSSQEARELFEKNKQVITLIALDACLEGPRLDTLPLLQLFRAEFSGTIVAMSGNPEYNDQLVSAGCQMACEKPYIYKTLRGLLTH